MNGKLVWIDLTIDNALETKQFYEQVVGWKSQAVNMGGYDDFSMHAEDPQ